MASLSDWELIDLEKRVAEWSEAKANGAGKVARQGQGQGPNCASFGDKPSGEPGKGERGDGKAAARPGQGPPD